MKPKILIARAIAPEVTERLSEAFEVETNPEDHLWSPSELVERLQGKAGAMTMGAERIDTALLAACPQLKICANLSSVITTSIYRR